MRLHEVESGSDDFHTSSDNTLAMRHEDGNRSSYFAIRTVGDKLYC